MHVLCLVAFRGPACVVTSVVFFVLCVFLFSSRVRLRLNFPDKWLVQYDCGKLQVLARLLREKKRGGHRCLIFTQMSKMLDVLEVFLNLHGHTYLRLDGATNVDARQRMMERFNRDPRVFVFILSTRSGGLGINLVGADTVVFYDSDWNPAMDAQAQDRAHRIGQTRDVHIYRLISEKTVEENILLKARQKRQLNDMSLEQGKFTMQVLQSVDIRQLIGAEQQGLPDDSLPSAAAPGRSAGAVEEMSAAEVAAAMAAVEDETDVAAGHRANQEAAAELAEFAEDSAAVADAAGGQGEHGGDGEEAAPADGDTAAAAASAPTTAKGKPKGKTVAKGKGKAAAKGTGKGKAKPVAKGKGKGKAIAKGKGKGKGKAKAAAVGDDDAVELDDADLSPSSGDEAAAVNVDDTDEMLRNLEKQAMEEENTATADAVPDGGVFSSEWRGRGSEREREREFV